jgi:hypothetical protein
MGNYNGNNHSIIVAGSHISVQLGAGSATQNGALISTLYQVNLRADTFTKSGILPTVIHRTPQVSIQPPPPIPRKGGLVVEPEESDDEDTLRGKHD